jgi:hypothetical protein
MRPGRLFRLLAPRGVKIKAESDSTTNYQRRDRETIEKCHRNSGLELTQSFLQNFAANPVHFTLPCSSWAEQNIDHARAAVTELAHHAAAFKRLLGGRNRIIGGMLGCSRKQVNAG